MPLGSLWTWGGGGGALGQLLEKTLVGEGE